jgi:hypothetical protein
MSPPERKGENEMKHGQRLLIVALVAAVLALTLAFAVNSGLATMAFEREPGTPPTGHQQFDVPADGDLCVLLENNRCGAERSEELRIP